VANLASLKRTEAKLIAEPIAVRPTKERGAALSAAAKARASAAFRMTSEFGGDYWLRATRISLCDA